MRLKKAFNNNVALATDAQGREIVVVGPGVSFQRREGDEIDPGRIRRTFRPEEANAQGRLRELLSEVPAEDIAVAGEIVELVRGVLGSVIDDRLLLPIADHISFALKRHADGVVIQYPLSWDVRHLYPVEVGIANQALDLIARRRGVRLPELETVPLALHFVNAQFEAGNLQQVVQMTELFSSILDIVRYEYMMPIEENSINAARFVTHLRYLFLRQRGGQNGIDDVSQMASAVQGSDPKAYETATRIRRHVENELGWSIGDDEVLFLSLHIHRLTGRGASP